MFSLPRSFQQLLFLKGYVLLNSFPPYSLGVAGCKLLSSGVGSVLPYYVFFSLLFYLPPNPLIWLGLMYNCTAGTRREKQILMSVSNTRLYAHLKNKKGQSND